MGESAETAPTDEGRLVEFIIERGSVERFAIAAQSESSAHRGDNAIIPPTYLMSVAQWMQPEDKVNTGFERTRVLHGSQEFRYLGPPPQVGARLTAQEAIVERFEKQGRKGGLMKFAVVETEFRDASTQERVATMRATIIERAAS